MEGLRTELVDTPFWRGAIERKNMIICLYMLLLPPQLPVTAFLTSLLLTGFKRSGTPGNAKEEGPPRQRTMVRDGVESVVHSRRPTVKASTSAARVG